VSIPALAEMRAPDDAPAPGRQKWRSFRFSLRELLLFMLVGAAVSAWAHGVYEKYRPFQPTAIADYFTSEFQKDIVAVRAELGEEGAAWSFEIPTTGEEMNCVNREWMCDLRLPREKTSAFRNALLNRVRHRFDQDEPDRGRLPAFRRGHEAVYEYHSGDAIQYRYKNSAGTLRIYLMRNDEQRVCLMANVSENRLR
jgi:hypothetical protein